MKNKLRESKDLAVFIKQTKNNLSKVVLSQLGPYQNINLDSVHRTLHYGLTRELAPILLDTLIDNIYIRLNNDPNLRFTNALNKLFSK